MEIQRGRNKSGGPNLRVTRSKCYSTIVRPIVRKKSGGPNVRVTLDSNYLRKRLVIIQETAVLVVPVVVVVVVVVLVLVLVVVVVLAVVGDIK